MNLPMKTALVIEDEETLRGYFAGVLEKLGIKVITADDGDSAIREMKKNPKVDLIILDLKMKRMGGKEAYPQLKRINPAAKVIVSSAYVGPEDEDELKKMGVDAVLRKPFPLLTFRSTVMDMLSEEQ